MTGYEELAFWAIAAFIVFVTLPGCDWIVGKVYSYVAYCGRWWWKNIKENANFNREP